jgi:hypothetical protein
MRKFLSLKILAIGRLEGEREGETKRGEMDGCCCAAKEDVRINGCFSSSYIRRIAIEPLCNLVWVFFSIQIFLTKILLNLTQKISKIN